MAQANEELKTQIERERERDSFIVLQLPLKKSTRLGENTYLLMCFGAMDIYMPIISHPPASLQSNFKSSSMTWTHFSTFHVCTKLPSKLCVCVCVGVCQYLCPRQTMEMEIPSIAELRLHQSSDLSDSSLINSPKKPITPGLQICSDHDQKKHTSLSACFFSIFPHTHPSKLLLQNSASKSEATKVLVILLTSTRASLELLPFCPIPPNNNTLEPRNHAHFVSNPQHHHHFSSSSPSPPPSSSSSAFFDLELVD
jgi:hypothetical protein